MEQERGRPEAPGVETLAQKVLAFKQTLSPRERALFAAMLLQAKSSLTTGEVRGFDASAEAGIAEGLEAIFPDTVLPRSMRHLAYQEPEAGPHEVI